MNKSSINIKPVSVGSSLHLDRDLVYLKNSTHIDNSLTKNNINWNSPDYLNPQQYRAKLEVIYKDKIGQKMQAKATPIREGVLNINPETTMDNLQKLAKKFKREFNITAKKISIHRDEGGSKQEGHINHHAHIVFDWTNSKTGKSIKLNKSDMVKMQDITAVHLNMERGISKQITGKNHKHHQVFKKEQELTKINRKLLVKKQSLEQLNSSINLPPKEQKLLRDKQKLTKTLAEKLTQSRMQLTSQNLLQKIAMTQKISSSRKQKKLQKDAKQVTYNWQQKLETLEQNLMEQLKLLRKNYNGVYRQQLLNLKKNYKKILGKKLVKLKKITSILKTENSVIFQKLKKSQMKLQTIKNAQTPHKQWTRRR